MSSAKILPVSTPYALASDQVEAVMQSFQDPVESLPRPPWRRLAQLTGPILPGTLMVIGAKSGNGKTSLLANYFVELMAQGIPTLYIVSADGGSFRFRKLLVALQCDFDKAAVMRNDWAHASPILSSPEAIERANAAAMDQLSWSNCGLIVDLPSMTRDALREALRQGFRAGAKVVMVDHVNRFSPKWTNGQTQELTETVKAMAATAAKKRAAFIVAAQITEHKKDGDPFAQYEVPPPSWLSQSKALYEESHVVLMCGRAIRPETKRAEAARMIENGTKEAAEYLEPGVMVVEVAKDRDGGQVGKRARLYLDTRSGLIDEMPCI